MKHLISLLFLAATVQISSASAALQPIETLYSGKGYPYKLLIDRAETINIIYTETNPDEITCSVKLLNNGHEWHSSTLLVNKSKFDDEPLASCLSRDTAKEWLARTFD